MRSFHAEDWYRIAGRGDVATVINDEDFENGTGHMQGERVFIDGALYVVKGICCWATFRIPKGAPIGLLVAPP